MNANLIIDSSFLSVFLIAKLLFCRLFQQPRLFLSFSELCDWKSFQTDRGPGIMSSKDTGIIWRRRQWENSGKESQGIPGLRKEYCRNCKKAVFASQYTAVQIGETGRIPWQEAIRDIWGWGISDPDVMHDCRNYHNRVFGFRKKIVYFAGHIMSHAQKTWKCAIYVLYFVNKSPYPVNRDSVKSLWKT